MAEFFITKKTAQSKPIDLPKHKSVKKPSPTKTGKGHFAATAQAIAKKRSGTLQHGVPKHAPTGASSIGGSKIPANSTKVQPTFGQFGLNEEQQGVE